MKYNLEKLMHTRLRETRKQLKIRQCDVAKLLGVCGATYSRYEKGVISLDATRLGQVADIYGVSVDYLLMRTDVQRVLRFQDVHPNTKQEYMDFLEKYSELDAHSRGALTALLEYEYQERSKE